MSRYAIEAEPAVEADVEAAFNWYENEEPGLGFEFLEELRAAYERILDRPYGYQDLRSEIRRALTRRFPYAVFLFRRKRSHHRSRRSSHGARSRRMAAPNLNSFSVLRFTALRQDRRAARIIRACQKAARWALEFVPLPLGKD